LENLNTGPPCLLNRRTRLLTLPRAAGLENDIIITKIVGYLDVQDAASVIFAKISWHWTNAARGRALPRIAECVLTLATAYPDDGEDMSDFEHLYPVIQRLPDEKRVLPKRCIIFEPKDEHSFRPYTYSRNHFSPADVTLRCPDGKVYRWSLIFDGSTREGNLMDVPRTNIYTLGPDDRFIVFRYYHEKGMREFPIKVFYKTSGDQLKLHCVSLPAGLFALLRDK
jgi:hypothetical protein